MQATEWMKLTEAFVATHVGESVEYCAYPSGSWQALTVPVDRQPVDEFGAALRSTIHVMLPKSLVATVNLQQDQIRLAPVAVGEIQRVYLVTKMLPQGNQPGHFWVECTEK